MYGTLCILINAENALANTYHIIGNFSCFQSHLLSVLVMDQQKQNTPVTYKTKD